VLGGVVGGAIVSMVVTHSIASKRTTAPGEETPAREVVAQPADSDRNAGLEWRLRRLEAQAAATTATADVNRSRAARDGGAAPPTHGFSQADQQAEQQRHAREYEETIRAHDREPVDGPWADKTARSLSSEMSRLSEAGRFAVTTVDCKTTTCKTVFRWPSYETALGAYASLLDHTYEANCTHTILLPAPPDPNAPYQATMLFDCEEMRAQQTR
jgi:hypothetical protein